MTVPSSSGVEVTIINDTAKETGQLTQLREQHSDKNGYLCIWKFGFSNLLQSASLHQKAVGANQAMMKRNDFMPN